MSIKYPPFVQPPFWDVDPGMVEPGWEWFWNPRPELLYWFASGRMTGTRNLGSLGSAVDLDTLTGSIPDFKRGGLYTPDNDETSPANQVLSSGDGSINIAGSVWDESTIFCVSIPQNVSDGNAHNIFTSQGNGTTGARSVGPLLLWQNTGGTGQCRLFIRISGTNAAEDTRNLIVSQPHDGRVHAILVTLSRAADEIKLFIDGHLGGSTDFPNNADTEALDREAVFGAQWDDDDGRYESEGNSIIHVGGLALSVWGEEKARQWSGDPFGPLTMAPRRIGFVAVAPGARPQGPLGHPLHGPFAGPIN